MADQSGRWRALADALRDDTLLWRGKPDETVASEHARVAAGGYPFDFDTDGEWIDVDGEEMVEGGVEDTLSAVAALVAPHGFDLRIEPVQEGEPGLADYVIALNGRPHTAMYADDWTYESPWWLATIRPLAWVNRLLDATPAVARLHTLYAGGNEGIARLLDPAVARLMRSSGLFDDRDVPSLPSDE